MDFPEWLTDGYVDKVRAFLSRNRMVVSLDDSLASRDVAFTLPYVDPRQLLFSPSIYVEDIYRDAVLVKIYEVPVTSLTRSLLYRLLLAYSSAKLSCSDAFIEKLSEVKV